MMMSMMIVMQLFIIRLSLFLKIYCSSFKSIETYIMINHHLRGNLKSAKANLTFDRDRDQI